MKPGFALVALMTLAACHSEDVGDSRQMAALNGCTERWGKEFPEIYGENNHAASNRAVAVMLPSEINFDSKGYFYFEQPYAAFAKSYDKQFICRRNIETRTIEFVGVDTMIKRAPAGASWSF
jgi:hypothetical protein